jgi:hypothetical protein
MAASGNRGAGLLSLGLLSLVASLVVARSGGKPPAAPAPALVKPAPAKSAAPQEPCEALGSLESNECSNQLRAFFLRNQLCAESSTVDTVVATFPDPSDSRLMSQSDQVLSSLVLAAETNAPLADFWLPWREDKDASATKENCHLRWPGAIVFQKVDAADPGKIDRTLLLLAGELPTAGVHQEQFKRALQIAFATSPWRELQVIGPTFSGSAASMRPILLQALKSAREEYETAAIQVITGSATDPGNQDVLTNKAAGLRFEATVASDDAVRAALFQYLVDKRIARLRAGSKTIMENVALLSEADTAYGNESHGNGWQVAYQIKFPIHIADVRSAWEKEDAVREATSSGPAAPQTALVPVDLQTRSADPTDDLPTFSRLTAAYDERSLTASLAQLESNGIEAVGIVATDVRDRLFLAEAIHRNAPDVQLFTFESDLLFAHPAYQDVMRGMIVASTYPLIPENQVWSARTRSQETRPRQFGGSTAQGVYNAAVRAYGDIGLTAEYSWPLVPGLSGHYPDKSPPVWISVVGGQALWPLQAVEPADKGYLGEIGLPTRDQEVAPPRPSPRIPEIGSPGSTAIVLFCVVILILCAVAFATVHYRRYGFEALNGPVWLLHPRLRLQHPGRTILCWLMLFVAFALLFLSAWLSGILAAAPEAFRQQMDPAFFTNHRNIATLQPAPWHFPRLLMCALASAAPVTAFLYAFACHFLEQSPAAAEPELAKIPKPFPWIACLAFFALTALAWLGIQACAKQIFVDPRPISSDYARVLPGEGVFSFVRLIHLNDSISLVAPTAALFVIVMLFAGNVCLTLYTDEWLLRRLERRAGEVDGPWSGVAGFFDGRLTRHSLARIAAAAVYVGIPLVWVFHNVHGTLDGAWGFVFLPKLVAVGTAMTLLGVSHMWLLWHRLKPWLDELANGPLGETLPKIKKEAVRLVGMGTTMRIASPHGLDVLAKKSGDEQEALRAVFAAGAAVTRLRGAWIRVSISTLLFLVTISVYPIHPHKQILVLGWFVVGSVVAATMWLFVEMSRNPTLSLLSDTAPGEVTWNADFVQKLLTFAALPVLGLITAQFPEVAGGIFSFLGPILQGNH